MTLEDCRTMVAIAAIITFIFEFVNSMYWAKMVDEHRVPKGWRWHLLTMFCILTPLVIWTLLFYALYTTAPT